MPQRRPLLLAGLAAAAGWGAAVAQPAAAPLPPLPPPELAGELGNVRWRGSGVMRWFGLHLYDAQLWTAGPPAADPIGHPLALALVYGRQLVGAQIASRSVDEMRRIGPFSDDQAARWLQVMTRLFPDVQAGDRLTGVHRPGQAVRFYFNGQHRGDVADADFARLFFGIWLSPRTSEPRLREQLLGIAP